MQKKYQLAVLITIVLAVIILTFGYQTIGKAITYPTDEELMAKVKDLIDGSPAKDVADLDACIIIQVQDKRFSYDVARENSVTTVTRSEYECRGASDEDIIIKFLRYSSFRKFTREPGNCDLWMTGGGGTHFYWLPSKAINPGFTANCDTRLCPAIRQCVSEEASLTQFGLSCCII